MKGEWKYFIVLNNVDNHYDLVEGEENGELLICCDVAVAKSFKSPEDLITWVKNNTSLKMENGDFKIEGQFLLCE